MTSLYLVENQEQGDENGCLPKAANYGQNTSRDLLFSGSGGYSSDGVVNSGYRQAISRGMF